MAPPRAPKQNKSKMAKYDTRMNDEEKELLKVLALEQRAQKRDSHLARYDG
jgi:hypothetical protein